MLAGAKVYGPETISLIIAVRSKALVRVCLILGIRPTALVAGC
jgi:hypothetical protein